MSDQLVFPILNVCTLNGGDHAILYYCMQYLKKHGLDGTFTVFDAQADIAKRYYPEYNFQKQWMLDLSGKSKIAKLLILLKFCFQCLLYRLKININFKWSPDFLEMNETIRQSELVFSTGGTYFTENYNIFPRLSALLLANAFKKRIVLLPQTVSFSRKPVRKMFLRFVLRRAEYIIARDKQTVEHLVGNRIPAEKIIPSADIVFLNSNNLSKSKSKKQISGKTKLKIGISVREWNYFKNKKTGQEQYYQAVLRFVQEIIGTTDAEITFVSTCQGIPEYRYNDARVASDILAGSGLEGNTRIKVISEFCNLDMLNKIITGFDLTISTRFHFALLSITNNVPTIPIAYEKKTAETFEALGLSDYVLHIDSLSANDLISEYKKLISNYELYSKVLDTGLPEMINRLAIMDTLDF
ncbi:MAG: polysaccharide pyruvyl transferase family protein [Spirochaetales bacterium]|nr:polysaccharide pyruvyl transferase family protein [Spirochaetales bacterium]